MTMRLTASPTGKTSTATPTVAMLRELELFLRMPDEELDQLCCILELSTVRPGDCLETQDVPVRRWHLVVHGHAVVERDATPIGLLGAGDSWGEHSLLNNMRSPIAVVALSPLTVLSASRAQVFTFPEDHPLLAGRLVGRAASGPDRLALPVLNALLHMSRMEPA
jgi:CRP-like cAMP-binding protein